MHFYKQVKSRFQLHLKSKKLFFKQPSELVGDPRTAPRGTPSSSSTNLGARRRTFEQTLKSQEALFRSWRITFFGSRRGTIRRTQAPQSGNRSSASCFDFIWRLFFSFLVLQQKPKPKEFGRRCSDNQFWLSIVQQRLTRNTSAAPWGSLLLMLLCLQPLRITQLGRASALTQVKSLEAATEIIRLSVLFLLRSALFPSAGLLLAGERL